MVKQFKTSLLSLLLALSLIVTPVTPVAAAGLPQPNAGLSTGLVADSQPGGLLLTVSETLKAAAKKRADVLTQAYGITSVQYALIHDGNLVLTGTSGYNDVATKTAPTNTTMYGIASVSKLFTTVAVLQLVENGKVSLDKPVTDYIPDFRMADERYRDITPRMLLNHSSGIMGSTLSSSILLGDENTLIHDSFLNILRGQRLKAAPGAFSVYCNDGFTLAEILVERVSGISFSDYIAQNIAAPLNLRSTKTPSDSFNRSKLAGIYDKKGIKLPYESLCTYGAGGLYSNASDLCKFSTIFTEDTGLLSKTLADAMGQEEYKRGEWYPEADSILSYGLGWDSVNTYPFAQYGIKALVKGGDSFSYHSGLVVLPGENMAAAVVCSGGSSGLAEVFANSLLLDYLKEVGRIFEIEPNKKFTAPEKTRIPNSLMSHQGFYGSYTSPLDLAMDKAGTLTVTPTGGEYEGVPQRFIYGGNNRFYSFDGSTFLSFVENNGKTYLYQSGYTNVPLIGQLAMTYYLGQKLDDNSISKNVLNAWKKYLDRDYYLVSEPYSSAVYISELCKDRLEMTEGLKNYILSMPITDKTTAKAVVEIPGMYGRDLSDIKLVEKNGSKYIQTGQDILICEENIKHLSAKSSFQVKIANTGYAKYYKITNRSANRKISVTLPAKSSFTVYDKNGNITFSSHISGKKKVKLPKDGTIVFVGSKKASFSVQYIN